MTLFLLINFSKVIRLSSMLYLVVKIPNLAKQLLRLQNSNIWIPLYEKAYVCRFIRLRFSYIFFCLIFFHCAKISRYVPGFCVGDSDEKVWTTISALTPCTVVVFCKVCVYFLHWVENIMNIVKLYKRDLYFCGYLEKVLF